MTIHVLGATGLIGTELEKCLEQQKEPYKSYNSKNIDITSLIDCKRKMRIDPGDWVINLAAIANPQMVEADEEHAYKVNVEGSENMKAISAENGANYFFMSSVEVFGNKKEPIKEEESLNPINKYGHQKAIAEERIWKLDKGDTIIGRTSWNISKSPVGRCLTDVMIESLKKEGAKMATDNIFTIACAGETAKNIYQAINSAFRGTIHIASPSPISRYEIANIVIDNYTQAELRCKACKFSDLKSSNKRSKYNVLDTNLSIKRINAIYSDPRAILIKKMIKSRG